MLLRWLGGLVIVIGLLLGGGRVAHAQEDCGITGYTQQACHAEFVPTRQMLGGGVQQLVYRSNDGAMAIYRAIPHSMVANYADPFKTLIDQARDTFMKDWQSTPREMWVKTVEGIDSFVMAFPGQRFVAVTPVRAGFLIGAFQIPSQTSPLFVYLKQERLAPRANPPQISHIRPRYPMQASGGSQDSGSTQVPETGALWRCDSQGTYKICERSSGSAWERNCRSRTSSAVGFGASRLMAQTKANGSCSHHMTKMILISNIGGGGYRVSGCRAISCRRVR
ncbi:hypothetical protein L6R29_09670 [Myxococcota bacterium]|nr:hypothetical protein [Myxococcota bacterium]